jgi:hypothetical protein
MKSLNYEEPEWRVRDILQALGTYRDVANMLEAKGHPRVPIGTISAWASRNSIPPSWLPAVIGLALEARVIGSIDDLRKRPQ